VGAIRAALDEQGFQDVVILSYAAKYASAFYGPFREAADSAPQFGDRRGYQMDPANARRRCGRLRRISRGRGHRDGEARAELLDIVRTVADEFDVPVAAYNVSGEFSMVKAAAANGWIDERRIVLEILTAIKRAGADIILTYHALDAAKWLRSRLDDHLLEHDAHLQPVLQTLLPRGGAERDPDELTTEEGFALLDGIARRASRSWSSAAASRSCGRTSTISHATGARRGCAWSLHKRHADHAGGRAEAEGRGCRARGISLDHIEPAIHDEFRQMAGAWERSVEGMRYCREAGCRSRFTPP